MKLLILTAIVAAVASSPLTQSNSWPWQVGKEYLYDVDTFTWTTFENSNSNGNAFKAQFIIRVGAPGQLLAKLSQPLYAQLQDKKITYSNVPSDLNFQPVQFTDQPLEIFVEGGRVKSFNVPLILSVAHENLLKGLISALQVDISPFGHLDSFPNSFDQNTFQGLFKKMETDVTGECETLYTVSPVSAEWHREFPKLASEEDPIVIVKSKDYGACKNRAAIYFGLPESAVWNGLANENEEKQFIKHFSESRLVAGKQGTVFKSEVKNSVFVSPLLFGKQKAEVYSYVKVLLSSVQEISDAQWNKTAETRQIDSLLFSLSESMFIPKVTNQSIANAQKLLQDLTPLLQMPNELPKADFLSKFGILVRIIGSLNSEQLTLLTSSIDIAKSSKNVAKNGMWIIYRDAVAQAGTVAAFREIRTWILTKKIQGEEAAELISSIGAALRYPTKEVFTEFFDFAMNPVVMEQQYLNNSALLAATKFMRFSDEHLFVVNTVIPRLSKYLKQAIDDGDSNRAQVYIRVLGNLAHPDVLMVFAPYLDGSIRVTKYLRMQIVASLKTLANLKNESVRAVLFSILRNTAEPYEIRVLAALNIFMAFPTAEMMLVMAEMTNYDPSTQVRAVLANGLNLAAELKDPRFKDLAKTAEAVKSFVSKEKFGYRLSTNSLIEENTNEDDIPIFRELSYVGSEDDIVPLYHRSAFRTRGTGWTEESQVTLSVSGVQQLLEYIIQLIEEPQQSKVDLKFSAKKVAEALNIKRNPRDPLAGSIFLENFNQQKLITFNEEDLKTFIANTVQNMEQLFKGVDVQYTKMLYQKQAYVVFPLAAGVPFFFEYSEPLMFSVNGKVKIKIGPNSKDLTGSLNKHIDIVYARNLDGSVGFLDTIGDTYAAVGIINKIQFYFPTNLNSVIESKQIKLKFVLPDQDATFIHFSVWPYSTFQKTDSLLTVSQEPFTKYIERPTKVVSGDYKVRIIGGVAIHLQGYSYSSDFKDKKDIYDSSLLTDISTLLYQKDVACTQFNLKYLAQETVNKDITFSLFYDSRYNMKQSGELGAASVMKDVSVDGEERREELVKRAASGVKSAEVQLFDFSTVFNGNHKEEYIFTIATAESFVDNKFQAIFFSNVKDQINGVIKVVNPKIAPLNFNEALKNKIKVTYEVDLKIGNSENIQIHGFGKRSEKYTEMLRNDPLGKQCLEESSQFNFYQRDCYKMIIKAHAPDYMKFNVTYKPLSPEFMVITQKSYERFKKLTSAGEYTQDLATKTDDGKLEIEVQSFYYDNYENYKFTSEYGEFSFNNVEISGYYPYATAIYAPIDDWERTFNYYSGYQYLPYCAVDSSKIQTFSGRSYEYSLTSSWHAVMVDEFNEQGQWNDLVILARRPSDQQTEVYISYKADTGKYVELEVNSTSIQVKSDTKMVSDGPLTLYWNDAENTPLLQYYNLADGVLVFNINDAALRLVYDGLRLAIFTSDHRTTTRGLCGQSSTQIRDDYMTPYGLVDLPDLYGASFSLDGEFSDPRTAELKKEAKLKAYQPVTKYTNIFRSDAEWSKFNNKITKGL
ncbi:hypothetical protein PYW08_010744 [Mythimna loreyi]|uniref:Uncharacterized protein n=1 Tax=Mythimna loreyi TaxID=667449 RepID=A0ACC2Q6M4_9NEOP|nr:hypothetical protein PYW08_010744 [Mythimna loreyi]